MQDAMNLIRKEYGNSNNFVTPKYEGSGWLVNKRVAYELSSGKGILDPSNRLWGVSTAIQFPNGATRRGKLHVESGCFHSRSAALAFIDELRLRSEREWGIA
jgi:hypothetical protein